MTDFAALDDALSDVIDLGPFGEAFRLVPRTKPENAPNAPAIADPTRPAVNFVGAYSGAPRRAPMDRAPIEGTAPTISAQADQFNSPPQVGDIIERSAMAETYEVRRIRRDKTGRVTIEVTSL